MKYTKESMAKMTTEEREELIKELLATYTHEEIKEGWKVVRQLTDLIRG